MLVIMNVRGSPGEFLKIMNDPTVIPSRVFLFNYQEFEYHSIGSSPSFNELVDYVNHHDVPLYVVNCNHEEDFYCHDITDSRYRNIQPILRYPVYYIQLWRDNFDYLLSRITNDEYDHLFVCLNLRPHWWRAHQVDLLEKYNLFEHGAISWNHWTFDSPLDDIGYQFRFWKPTYKNLTEPSPLELGFPQNQLPEEYHRSFMQLVTESTIKCNVISEKTIAALAMKKPFLVSSCKGFHKMLVDLGFQLYDEIFDYNFDSEPDTEIRFDMIAKNIYTLTKYSKKELVELYATLLPKIEHNYKNFKRISTDCTLVPKPIADLCEEHHSAITTHEIYNLYHKMKSVHNNI